MNNVPTLVLVVIALINGLISCGSTTSEEPLPIANYQSSSLEGQVFEEVNRYRTSKGLNSLLLHEGLSSIAQKHSARMAIKEKLDHSGYSQRSAQAKFQFGLMNTSENVITYGDRLPTARKLVQKWIDSPPHKKNMLGDFDSGGLSLLNKNDLIYGTFFFGKTTS